MEELSTAEAMRILELDGRIDPRAVKTAYRRLARRHHPDHGGDPATFQRIQAAYDALHRTLPHLRRSGAPAEPRRVASVTERWWGSPTGFEAGEVDLSVVDWTAPLPDRVPFRVDRDVLARLLDASDAAGPVRPVTIRSRAPSSRLHRMIGWLQADLLSGVAVAPAAGRPGDDPAPVGGGTGGAGGIRGRVEIRMHFPQLRARRIAGEARLPHGWVARRTSSSVTITRTLQPSLEPRATALRTAGAVADALEAMGWPLSDWFVVAE